MKDIDITSIRLSFDRLVEAVDGYNKQSDRALWLQLVRRETGYLLRRVFRLWLKLKFRKD